MAPTTRGVFIVVAVLATIATARSSSARDDEPVRDIDDGGYTECFDSNWNPMPCDSPCGLTYCRDSMGRTAFCPPGTWQPCDPPPPPPANDVPLATCYGPDWSPVSCWADCGVAYCYDQRGRAAACFPESTRQCPAMCFDANGNWLDCATDCGAARCTDWSFNPVECPDEIANCAQGPTVCTDAGGMPYDEVDDCQSDPDAVPPPADPPPCDPTIANCATPEDDAQESDPEPPPGEVAPEFTWKPITTPPLEGLSSCACASSGGQTTGCAYEVRFVKFVPISAPWGDKKAEVEHISFDVLGSTVSFNGGSWQAPSGIPVGYEVNVGRVITTLVIPCGTARDLPVKISAQELDEWGPDEKGDAEISLHIACPGGVPVTNTTRVQLKNGRGKVKHEWDITVEARVANQCGTIGAVPSCPIPPNQPLAACEYDVRATSLYHRDSPNLDKWGEFQGWVGANTWGQSFPPVRVWVDHGQLHIEQGVLNIKRGRSGDVGDLLFGHYSVPCGSTLTPQALTHIWELDGIFKSDEGDADVAPTLTCPPSQSTTYKSTELKLYGNASKPRHIVDLTSRQQVTNLNYCQPEPQHGLVIPCSMQGELISVTKVSGSLGQYDLSFVLGDQEHSFQPRVSDANPVWVPADWEVSGVFANVSIPCGQQVVVPLTIQGVEKDAFIVRFPSEHATVQLLPALTCAAPYSDQTYTIRMEFKNKRGKTKDVADVKFRFWTPKPADVCTCRP